MSEFHVVEIQFKEKECLVKALEEMGYKPIVHKESVNLYGYQGDKRVQKAHIVIPKSQVGAASNDIGFERTSTGYIMHISEFDERQKRFNINKFKQIYASKVVQKNINGKWGKKFSLKSKKVDKHGNIRIVIRSKF